MIRVARVTVTKEVPVYQYERGALSQSDKQRHTRSVLSYYEYARFVAKLPRVNCRNYL